MPYVAGAAVVRCSDPAEASLEELAFEAAAAALADAGLTRAGIDGVVLAASDQLDGRVISSMHLAGPAGGYLRDEIKVSDDSSAAFTAAVLRLEAGVSSRVLAVSWAKRETDPAASEAPNSTPADRELGLHPLCAEALVAGLFAHRHGIPLETFGRLANHLAGNLTGRLAGGGAGSGGEPGAGMISTPLRRDHLPPEGDAAVAVVLCAEPTPVSVAGLAWGAEHGDPMARPRPPEEALARLARQAYRLAGLDAPDDVGVVETTERNVFRLCLSAAGLGLTAAADAPGRIMAGDLPQLNRAGGLWAEHTTFAAGLERIAHAAKAVRDGVETAIAHSSYGRAGQGQFVTVLRRES